MSPTDSIHLGEMKTIVIMMKKVKNKEPSNFSEMVNAHFNFITRFLAGANTGIKGGGGARLFKVPKSLK